LRRIWALLIYGVTKLASQYTTDYDAQASVAVVVTMRALISQRRIVTGLTAGAVKG
jgi:ABC-type glycerol-3-phosphate transport system permease component